MTIDSESAKAGSDSDSNGENSVKKGQMQPGDGSLMQGEAEAPKQPKKKQRTPGTLSELSESCRLETRDIASTHLYITAYDNINMMIRIAEQIVGRKSTYLAFES